MTLKTPQQWAMEEGMWISDPRGWADGTDFDAPTTYEDYFARFLSSGVVPYSAEHGGILDDPPAATTVVPTLADITLPELPTPSAVWVAYHDDFSSIFLFDSELAALRHAVGNGMQVRQAEFGVDLTELT